MKVNKTNLSKCLLAWNKRETIMENTQMVPVPSLRGDRNNIRNTNNIHDKHRNVRILEYSI